MKTASLTIVLLLSATLVADEPREADKQAPAKPESVAAQPANASQNDQASPPKGDAQDEGEDEAEKPLHEHPVVLKMLARNNELRAARGLRPHRINPALTKAAQDHAAYMARTRVFSHYSNGGPGGRAVRHGFGAGVRENIGYGYGSVENMFTTWFNSSGHWANMMSNTADVGFGYALSPSGTPYWVAVYGTAPAGQEPEEAKTEVQQASATEDAPKDGGKKPAEKSDSKSESKSDSERSKDKKDPAVVPASGNR